MKDTVTLTLEEAESLTRRAFIASNTSVENAAATARALVAAEADGQHGHGLSRVPSYAAQSASGKVNGLAKPAMEKAAAAAVRIDAGYGFAYPAIELAVECLPGLAAESGIAVAAIHRSHHFGQAGAHAERLATRGVVALVFGNSPKGIAFWGSNTPMMGTNPIAFAAPLPDAEPLVIDLALSQAARGKIVAAQKAGESIPEGWALDAAGKPTTDPAEALQGSMVPIGGAKGAALALMVEILAAALTGSHFGFEASSLFEGRGDAPDLGHLLLAIDPNIISGDSFWSRMATLVQAVDSREGARFPGLTRLENRRRASRQGVSLAASLHAEILNLAENNR